MEHETEYKFLTTILRQLEDGRKSQIEYGGLDHVPESMESVITAIKDRRHKLELTHFNSPNYYGMEK